MWICFVAFQQKNWSQSQIQMSDDYTKKKWKLREKKELYQFSLSLSLSLARLCALSIPWDGDKAWNGFAPIHAANLGKIKKWKCNTPSETIYDHRLVDPPPTRWSVIGGHSKVTFHDIQGEPILYANPVKQGKPIYWYTARSNVEYRLKHLKKIRACSLRNDAHSDPGYK